MNDEEIRAKGWSVLIYRAVEYGGGPVTVAHRLGLAAMTTPMSWYKNRSIRAQWIEPLCRLGGYRVTPQQILDELAVPINPDQEGRAAA